jgi:hypothetical protein
MPDERLEKARQSLERVQRFDTSALPQEEKFGQDFNFREAIEPANRIINLFRQYPSDFLDELPPNQLNTISNTADSLFQILNQILTFDAKEQNAFNRRNDLINSLKNQYQPYFDQLQQLISYGASRQRDFGAMERDFRASMQRAADDAANLMKQLEGQGQDARRILEEVRKVAAEQGVSQQARYFQEESEDHDKQAQIWRKWTVYTSLVLAVDAVLSAFMHKLSWLAPSNSFESVQLGLSKFLIFAVLAYLVLLCARNFLSHTHNAIVNKHRQNALLTFNALVDAAGSEERRDVILTYAAACIFSPQDTGYTKGSGGIPYEMPMSIIQALPKLATGGTHS